MPNHLGPSRLGPSRLGPGRLGPGRLGPGRLGPGRLGPGRLGPGHPGIDNGLTVTKAVIFDLSGNVLSIARRPVPQSLPKPHFVERDMAGLWRATADAIAGAIALCDRPATDILAVAATAHGDGLYLLDASRRPLGPGILSLDSRAGGIVSGWSDKASAAPQPDRPNSPCLGPLGSAGLDQAA